MLLRLIKIQQSTPPFLAHARSPKKKNTGKCKVINKNLSSYTIFIHNRANLRPRSIEVRRQGSWI